MKRMINIFILLSASFFFMASVASAQIIVRVKPQVPKVVVIKSKPPVKGYVWRDGHWKIHKNKYVWVKGHWVKPRRNHVWTKGHWKQMHRGWVWVPGRWTRANAWYSQR